MKAKRIVSILLTGSMLLSLLPVSALAAAPVFDAPAQTTAKKAAPLVQEADASRSTEEEASTRSSRDLDAENGTAESITTIQLNAEGKPESRGDDDHWGYDPSSGGRLYLNEGVFTLQPSSEAGAESALQENLYIDTDAKFNSGTIGGETYNYGTISDGTFQRSVYNYKDISGGIFQGMVRNTGTISNGTFQGKVDNDGVISGGIFQGEVYNSSTISDGTFRGPVDNWKTISGGTFQGDVYNTGTISGGTFQGEVTNNGTISDGNFQEKVANFRTISGGTFEEVVEMNESPDGAKIEGGTFKKGIELNAYYPTITDGLFDGKVSAAEGYPVMLSISGGLFTKAVDVSNINAGKLSITGGYFASEPTLPEGSDTTFATVSDLNYRAFRVPVNGDWSENGYSKLYVPHGMSERQANTITVKTNTALIDCLADGETIMGTDKVRLNNDGSYTIEVYQPTSIVLVTEEPSAPPTDNPGGELDSAFTSGAAALGVVLGTAGLGYLTYICGSSLYLSYVLPDGFIPSTQQELATVLWTTAGKPDPVSTALYTDISADSIELQKAARWCAEQGLLSDHGTTFGADARVTNARIIRAWNSLKKVPVTIQ